MPGSFGTGKWTVTRSSSGLSRSHPECSRRNCTALSECFEPSTARRILIRGRRVSRILGLGLQLLQAAALAVARVGRVSAALADLHRAILELGDLAERVELRVGQDVGRSLVVRERDENAATRRAGIFPRVQRDFPAS